MEGWIKIHRKIQNHWIYQEKREYSHFEAWIDLLIQVNHADAKVLIKGALFEVKRGESINSLETWSKRWNWNKSKVRRFLILLQKDGMIEYKSETQTTRVTICNYDAYQETRNADETQMKRKRNADETRVNPNKNVKNVKNELTNEEEIFEYNIARCLEKINLVFGKKYRFINDKDKAKFKLLLEKYKWEDVINAIKSVQADKFHQENNYKYATPEYFTRPKTIDKHGFMSEIKPTYTGEDAGLVNYVQNYYNKP